MTEEEVAAAAAFINHDWGEHPPLPDDAPPAVPGDLHVKSTYPASGWVPFHPAGEPEPVLVDNNRWRRTRLVEASSIAQTITIAFHWPSDAADPHTYLMIVDAANWSVDHRLTSSVIWARLNEIQSIPNWTTSQTVRVSDRLSVLVPFTSSS